MSNTYKLTVPKKVEEKIRYLIRKFPHTEWSGILFYSHTGSFEEGNLSITCEDIYPMDLGSAGWTEFKMSADVASYIAENVELFDCETGLVHSHHTLGAFFSGQDSKMLQQEGNDTNCFVSLVVDTKGTYVAAITRKVEAVTEVEIKPVSTSYQFFGEGAVSIPNNTETESTSKTITKSVVQYFDLSVTREVVDNPLEFLDERFEEIQNKKAANTPPKTFGSWGNSSYNYDFGDYSFKDYQKEKTASHNAVKEPTLWDDATMKELEVEPKSFYPDPTVIHTMVCRMLTCSLTLNTEKFDLEAWIDKHMVTTYKKVFNDDVNSNYVSYNFRQWCDFVTEFMVDTYEDDNMLEFLATGGDELDIRLEVTNAMMEELKSLKSNRYIDAYISALETLV